MNITKQNNFYENTSPEELIKKYGSPLYVYNEKIFRQRLNEMKNLVEYKNFKVNYSAKANSNLALLQIVKEEGLNVDALSMGEIYIELEAGFKPENILFVSNNISKEEMEYAISKNIIISVDSLSQLEQYGKINPNGKIAIRFNPGIGAGHHEKVITGGKNTKFGVNPEYLEDVKSILNKYNLKLIGINQHIGSLFMDKTPYLEGVKHILDIAMEFDDLLFIDIGGGFGIPYKKFEKEERLDLKELGKSLDKVFTDFSDKYGKEILFKIEPGRYIAAECGVLLGTVHATKYNGDKKYVGTDIGFNVLQRPILYDAYHEIEVYNNESKKEVVDVVGNICESGDILAKERLLPKMSEDDIIGVLDAGAYGMVMSSNYNNRLRPAEVLIRENGEVKLIRKRDTLEDLVKNYIPI